MGQNSPTEENTLTLDEIEKMRPRNSSANASSLNPGPNGWSAAALRRLRLHIAKEAAGFEKIGTLREPTLWTEDEFGWRWRREPEGDKTRWRHVRERLVPAGAASGESSGEASGESSGAAPAGGTARQARWQLDKEGEPLTDRRQIVLSEEAVYEALQEGRELEGELTDRRQIVLSEEAVYEALQEGRELGGELTDRRQIVLSEGAVYEALQEGRDRPERR